MATCDVTEFQLEPTMSGGSGYEDEMVSDIVESGLDPDKNSSQYMAILVEALSILGRVQDALDVSGGCGL